MEIAFNQCNKQVEQKLVEVCNGVHTSCIICECSCGHIETCRFFLISLRCGADAGFVFFGKTQARHSKTIRRSLLSEFDFLPASFRHLDTSFQVTNEWYVQGRQVIKHLLKSHTLPQCGNIESCTNSLVILLSVTVPTSILCPVVCLPFHMQTYL